jgi:hypothetical protein
MIDLRGNAEMSETAPGHFNEEAKTGCTDTQVPFGMAMIARNAIAFWQCK